MDYLYHVLIMACLYAVLATSFNIVVGLAGLFALAHAVFYAVGAYTTGILATRLGIGFPWALIAGVGIAAAIGVATALPALRVGGHYLVIMTLALQVIAIDTLQNAQSLTGGPDGISGVPKIVLFGWSVSSPGRFLVIAFIFAVGCVFVARVIERSPFGRALRAMRENELAAEAIGKDVVRMKVLAFALSAGLAAVPGALLAHYIGFVGPQSFTVEETIYVLAMVILGGTGNLIGSVIGAIVLVALPELLKFVDLPPATADMMRNVIYGVILIVILRFRPKGILPESHAFALAAASGPAPEAMAAHAVERTPGEVVLAGSGLCKRFGGIVAADEVEISLRAGQVTGLIGPNGAGKSTAFNLLTGFLQPDAGETRYRGNKITGMRPHAIVHAGIARSFQDLKLFEGMTVLENVLVALPQQAGDRLVNVFLRPGTVAKEEATNIARARSVLAFVGLDEKSLEDAASLSFAEEKLLVIARLLATGADVLLLDEPLSGLDPTTLKEILPTIRRLAERGHTVCIIEHNLDVIRGVCDVAYYLDEGRVLAVGTPEELMRDPQLVRRYLR